MKSTIITALVLVALGQPADAPAQEADLLLQIQPRKYTAYRSIGAVDIDGRLDEPSWQRAAWTDLFVDIEGEETKLKPRFSTRAKMLWDDTYFYVAAEMEEPQGVRAPPHPSPRWRPMAGEFLAGGVAGGGRTR